MSVKSATAVSLCLCLAMVLPAAAGSYDTLNYKVQPSPGVGTIHQDPSDTVTGPTGWTFQRRMVQLPPGAVGVVINGKKYWTLGGVYFQSAYENGSIFYEAVEPAPVPEDKKSSG